MIEEQCIQPEEINPDVMAVKDERKEARTKPVDKLETYPLFREESDKVSSINSSLEESQKEAATALVQGHASSFAWKPSNMPGSILRSYEEKTSFIAEDGTYCYKTMLFGLKNVEATYQRLIKKIFKNQIRRIVEVYFDDMVVKSKTFQQYLTDLKDVFQVLKQYKMGLNPAK
ncbi:uncharacterized protein LOC110615353 [Manihot esculenta]|uniref:uncharacterized protein LOC110615353 n=1 Tax=Manihot esculenta TaxID=3983 RepID=UPI000B5D682B|nr:uncharacterized protein LOC110615353 [Manihot esculenta]